MTEGFGFDPSGFDPTPQDPTDLGTEQYSEVISAVGQSVDGAYAQYGSIAVPQPNGALRLRFNAPGKNEAVELDRYHIPETGETRTTILRTFDQSYPMTVIHIARPGQSSRLRSYQAVEGRIISEPLEEAPYGYDQAATLPHTIARSRLARQQQAVDAEHDSARTPGVSAALFVDYGPGERRARQANSHAEARVAIEAATGHALDGLFTRYAEAATTEADGGQKLSLDAWEGGDKPKKSGSFELVRHVDKYNGEQTVTISWLGSDKATRGLGQGWVYSSPQVGQRGTLHMGIRDGRSGQVFQSALEATDSQVALGGSRLAGRLESSTPSEKSGRARKFSRVFGKAAVSALALVISILPFA